MSKMSEMSATIEELRKCAAAISDAANWLAEQFNGSEPEPEAVPAEPVLTLEAVRVALADKSRAGFTAQIRSLLQMYGADKLSGVDAANYKALLTDVEGINDATAYCIIIADGTLQIIDYKHGLGVLVGAEENLQMQCYALGALELFDGIYDIDSVRMTIYQPRRDNVSSCEISKDELSRWADEVLKPTADLAFAGDENFLCGEWCGFCKAKHECRARAENNLELARCDFKLRPLLTDDEVEDILARADDLISWSADIKGYALQQAISGKEWHSWKLVEGCSNRRYTNETAVAGALTDAGFNPCEHKVLGVTAMQKMLGKSRFDELLAAYIEKPQGKPTLVPERDKRPAMNTAKNDFMEENDYE